jgi:hypothetical protein
MKAGTLIRVPDDLLRVGAAERVALSLRSAGRRRTNESGPLSEVRTYYRLKIGRGAPATNSYFINRAGWSVVGHFKQTFSGLSASRKSAMNGHFPLAYQNAK